MRYVLLPPANEVWGKVIFSQASVILFTWRGSAQAPLDADLPSHADPLDADPPWMQTPPQDTWGTMGYGQQAGGTHPTKMLSISIQK